MYIYQCEDSPEGILTAVYNIYEDRRSKEEVLVTLNDEPRLFAEVIEVCTDNEKAGKVTRTLQQQFGESDYRAVCFALASPDPEKAQAVYQTIRWGLAAGCGRNHLFDHLSDPYVNKAFKLARNADREYAHLRGFIRFEELQGEILYAQIEPRNDVLLFLMPHFADRFPEENFIIHDVRRNLFGIHRDEGGLNVEDEKWYLLHGEEFMPEELRLSDKEIKFRALFKSFCESIAIDSRRNEALQRNMLPLHFREYMTEFRG